MKHTVLLCFLFLILAGCSKSASSDKQIPNRKQLRGQKESAAQPNWWEEQFDRLLTSDFSNLKLIVSVGTEVSKPSRLEPSADEIDSFTKLTCKKIFEPRFQVFTNLSDVPEDLISNKCIDEFAGIQVRVIVGDNGSNAVYYVESKLVVGAGTLTANQCFALGMAPSAECGKLVKHSIWATLSELSERVTKANLRK